MGHARLRRLTARALAPAYISLATALWVVPFTALALPMVAAAARGQAGAILALVTAGTAFITGATAGQRLLHLRAWERDGAVYRRIGVRRFRAIALRGDIMTRIGRRIAGYARPAVARATDPALLRWNTRNERIHWAWALATPPLVVWSVAHGNALIAALVLTALLPLNLYPIALQRYTRGRLEAAAQWHAVRRPR